MSPTDQGYVDHSPTPSLEDPRSHAQSHQSRPKNEVVESPMGHYDVDANLADENDQRENDQRDTLSELFNDLEQLVASPPTLNNAAPAESELELPALYNPSLVTPGAPSLPSARHKIAKLPYHLSTDHHSAILSLSNPLSSVEAITEEGNDIGRLVPRKRPHPSSHQEDSQRKRSRQPPHDSSSPNPFQPTDVPFQPTDVPFVPQKRPRISNPRDDSNCKRSCVRSNDQGIAQTSANDSMSRPHDNATPQDPRVGVKASTTESQHLPQTHTQTYHTPITQLADSSSQNHDKTNNLTSPESREASSLPQGLPTILPLEYVRRTPTQSRTHSRESTTRNNGGSPLNPDHVQSSRKSPNSTSDLRLPVSHIQRSPSVSTSYNPSLSQSLKSFQTHQQPANRRDPGDEEPQSSSPYPTYTHSQISPKSHPGTFQEFVRRESQHPPSPGYQRLTRSLNLPTSSSQYTSKSNNPPRARSQEASRQTSRNQSYADAQISTSQNRPNADAQISTNQNRPSSLSPDITFQSASADTQNLSTASLLPSPEVSRKNNKSPLLDQGYVETSPSPIHNPYNISNPPYEGRQSTYEPPRMMDSFQYQSEENRVPYVAVPAMTPEPPQSFHLRPPSQSEYDMFQQTQPQAETKGYQSAYLQPRMTDGFQFQFGGNQAPYVPLPAVTAEPPQSFYPRPPSSRSEYEMFQQTQPHAAMEGYQSTDLQPRRTDGTQFRFEGNRAPYVASPPVTPAAPLSFNPRPSSQREHDRPSTRMSNHPNLNFQDRSASQNGVSSRISLGSREFQQYQNCSASQSNRSTRMSIGSQEFQQDQGRISSQSGRSSRMSIGPHEFQQDDDRSASRSRQSSRIFFRPENDDQHHPPTYQHPPLALAHRTSTPGHLHHTSNQTEDTSRYNADHDRIPHSRESVLINTSIGSQEFQQDQGRISSQSGRSSRMSIGPHEFQQDDDRSASRSRQSSRISFRPENDDQRNPPTYQHPALALAHRTSTQSIRRPNGPSPPHQSHHPTAFASVLDLSSGSHLNEPPQSRTPSIKSHISDTPYKHDPTTYNLRTYNLPQAQVLTNTQIPPGSHPSRDSQVHTQIQTHAQTVQREQVQHSPLPNPAFRFPQTPASQMQNRPSVQQTLWDGFRFQLESGGTHGTAFDPQFYNPRQNDGPSRTEPIVFQQPQTQPTSFARMSICSTQDQPNHDGPSQTEPNIIQRPPSQTSFSRMSICSTREQPTRMSICSTRDQPNHDGPSQTDLNVLQQPPTQSTSLFRMSICSTPNQPSQPPTHRQSVHSTQNQPNQPPTHRQIENSTQNQPNQEPTRRQSVHSTLNQPNQPPTHRQSENSTQNQPNQQPTHRQSENSTQNQPNQQPTHRQSVNSTQNQPNQQPSNRQSVQSQRISASAANDHQSNSNSTTRAATSPHQPDSAPPSSHGAEEDDVQEDDDDTPESDFDGVFDLGEHHKYENWGASRRAQKTLARHDGTRYERLAKDPVECSQYKRLTIAIHHFNNLLLGIVRKRKRRKGNRLLPLPPSDDEYSAWDKRKTERRRIVDKTVEKARDRYLRKHPKALPAQLAKVADHAAEDAISTIPPVKFTSLVALRNSGVLYSTTVASICKGALALSGFARFTYDWTDTIKSKWNEAVSCIIIQEWEKCYKRGDADDYDIDSTQVTAKNLRQVIDRWFKTKAREFSKQPGEQTQEDDANQALLQEAAKEKTRRRESRKRVCKLRENTVKRIFPEHQSPQALLSEKSIHSEDEVDSTGHSYRKPKLRRHQDLNEFLHELDALYIKEQQNDQAITSATKTLQRGPYAAISDSDYLARPPKGFPKALLDQDFMNRHVSRVAVLGLQLSAHKYELRPLIERIKWLQLPEAS